MAKGKPRLPRREHPDVAALLTAVRAHLGPDAVRPTSGQHYKVIVPGAREVVIVPQSPSDWRSIRNCRSKLRRLGVQV